MNSTRRNFLKKSGSLVAGAVVTPLVSTKLGATIAPSDTVRIALIGCNGMGHYDLKDHLKIPGVDCVAMCDVDENILNERAADITKLTGKAPKLYKDYRKIMDDKSIDAVIVGTPDHWHCLPTVHACEAGKDVYVEKPLANSIAECQVMLGAARRYNRVVQVGQQQRSGQHWHDALAVVKSQQLGKIRKIKTWGFFEYGKTSPRVPDSPVPAGVDFEMWLGPAPSRTFNTGRFHGNWRFSWDYGGGLLTDWGVHLLDIALWAVDGDMPKSILSAGGIYAYKDNAIETADTQTVIYEYDDLLIEWEHAGGLNKGYYGRNYGVAFIGNNGTLVINREGWEIMGEIESGKPKIEALPLQAADKKDHEKHVSNFIACVKSRQHPICDVEIGRNSAMLAHMGNIAYRTGDKLYWDKTQQQFKDNPNANGLMLPSYRNPWEFPVL
ncbi:MAG: Gfo/Idh/MocA family oxidoreductase [Cyclobacteriaceae bacterium]|nr:Gfo/Idh/MocA family oxidoreductase [Cyclobacteriaceae bacterium]MDH4295668.1 Gfo/Idh/MocA family oxidoreductase [Cyclobacteriaceae bacterium]MDH5249980.1 Gfo/Idh/MocA family oxidoreductase [Cyclobacteriaceae bacterium]